MSISSAGKANSVKMCCREIKAHVPDPFWYLVVEYQSPEGNRCTFDWCFGRSFDYGYVTQLFELCIQHPRALVTKVPPPESWSRAALLNAFDLAARLFALCHGALSEQTPQITTFAALLATAAGSFLHLSSIST